MARPEVIAAVFRAVLASMSRRSCSMTCAVSWVSAELVTATVAAGALVSAWALAPVPVYAITQENTLRQRIEKEVRCFMGGRTKRPLEICEADARRKPF